MSDFTSKTVLLTGGARGLGAAMAREFASRGARVFVGYRVREREARAVCHSCEGEALAWKIDVRDADSVERAVREAGEKGPLDVLVNNAGITRDGPAAMMSLEDFTDVLDANLTGAFRCARAVLRPMMARKSGAIVNVGSVAGLRASAGQANYAASKGALLALTQTLAVEAAPYGVRVNAVVPGLFSAGMASRLDKAILAQKLARVPLGRAGAPEECARAVAFLASEAASYIVGQALVVDGGISV